MQRLFCYLWSKHINMKIFNVTINGKDADNFMDLSCDAKKEWIKANTNQQNDDLINAFIKSVKRGTDEECQGCKDKKAAVYMKPIEPPIDEPIQAKKSRK